MKAKVYGPKTGSDYRDQVALDANNNVIVHDPAASSPPDNGMVEGTRDQNNTPVRLKNMHLISMELNFNFWIE